MIILTDIHGNFKTMIALLDKIPQEEKDKGIIICGDLIDRGPKSKEIVQWCIDNNIQVVMGNHEKLMITEGPEEMDYYIKNKVFDYNISAGTWMINGGIKALRSYINTEENENGTVNKTFDTKTFLEHIEWMKNLPYYLEFKDIKNHEGRHLLITHSSASRVWKWDEKEKQSYKDTFNRILIWNRDRIQDIPGIYNVFGHTPIKNGPKITNMYANIDTGCFYNEEDGYNTLTALQYPEMIVYQQENIDRSPSESTFGEIED